MFLFGVLLYLLVVDKKCCVNLNAVELRYVYEIAIFLSLEIVDDCRKHCFGFH